MSKVCDINGNEIDFQAAVNAMDDDLREQVCGTVESDQEFIELYAEKHEAAFGEKFAPYHGIAW